MRDSSLPGPPPCARCRGYCCKSDQPFIVRLLPEEAGKYHAAAYDDKEGTHALPTVDGRCVYLDDNDRCRVYADRPQRCREFSCLAGYAACGGRHSFLLEDHPDLVELLEAEYPAWTRERSG